VHLEPRVLPKRLESDITDRQRAGRSYSPTAHYPVPRAVDTRPDGGHTLLAEAAAAVVARTADTAGHILAAVARVRRKSAVGGTAVEGVGQGSRSQMAGVADAAGGSQLPVAVAVAMRMGHRLHQGRTALGAAAHRSAEVVGQCP
jgi:uncharacterized phage protein gp47/JayE